ncbi:MAG: type II toxin-antitoxin system RelE/ParE family toxin [Pseudomonadota bacterium]
MAYDVDWSPAALEDVESLAQYIARDSVFYAGAVVSKILDAAGELKRFPWAGRAVPEFEDATIRERFVYSYRPIYRVEGNKITILAIIHGKRLPDLLGDRIKGE